MSNTESQVWPIEDFPPDLNVYELDGSPGTYRVGLNGDEIGEGDIGIYVDHLGTPDEVLVASIEGVGRPQDWDADGYSSDQRLEHYVHTVSSLVRKANEIQVGLSIIEIDTSDPLVLQATEAMGLPDRWSPLAREGTTAFERTISDTEALSVGSKATQTSIRVSPA